MEYSVVRVILYLGEMSSSQHVSLYHGQSVPIVEMKLGFPKKKNILQEMVWFPWK